MAAATGLSVGAVASALRAIEEPRSLDAPGEGMALHDALEDPDAVHPLEAIASRELANAGGTLLKHLTPREQLVLRMRFGFAGRRPRTLTEIGQRFSLTRERIRQIESGALQKLRETPLVSHLRGHLEP
jgi:RNA polymerase primary sigma factor